MSKDKQPEIRFPGFTEDWEQRKLGEVSPLRGGFAFKSNKFVKEGIPIVRISNILSNGSVGGEFVYYTAQEKDENYLLPDKSALLAMSGATTGKVSILNNPNNNKVYQNQRVGYFTKTKNVDYSFISTLVRSKIFLDQLNSVLVAGAQPNISSKDINVFELTIPKNIEEQKKIGNFFKQLDDTITLHQRKLDLLKETKKGFLQKMFPKNGAKVPEVRFPGFTEAWEERKVGEIFKVTRGQVLAATETSESITEKNIYPVYSSQTKNDGLMGYYSDYLFDTAITWTTDGANAGTVNYRNGKFYSTNVNGVLLSDKGYANKAVAEIINRIAWKHVSKVGNPKLMNNVMSEITITIPSVEEQETISRFFTQLDSTITLHERELDLLKETKKGFLQKMFV